MNPIVPTGFTLQYAIKLPDGEFFKFQFGAEHPSLFGDRSHAEQTLNELREGMRRMGIHEWAGRIVFQLVSPFLDLEDPAASVVDEISAWLKSQGGQ